MTRARTTALAVAALLLLVSSCSGDGTAETTTLAPSSASADTTTPSTATTTASTSASTTTTTTTSTTLLTVTTPPTSTPGTVPIDSEDFVVIVQGLLDLRDQINAAPDPARASEVYAGGPRLLTFENQLANAQQAGQRTVDVDRTIVLSAAVAQVLPSNELGEFVDVKVVQQYPTNWGRIIDANGETVFDLVPDPPPTEPTVEVRYTLNRSAASGQWLIAFINGE